MVHSFLKQSLLIEPLLGVIREQGEWPFRHKGAGSKGQNSQGSREHENCNQGAGSTLFVSKMAAESNQLTNLVSKQAYSHKSASLRGKMGSFPIIFFGSMRRKTREHSKKLKRSREKREIKREQRKN